MKTSVKKRIDLLYEDEVRRWREAWITFSTDVWRPFTEHELAFAIRVTQHDEDKARLSEVEPVVVAECIPWTPENAEAWVRWTYTSGAFWERCPDDELLLRSYEALASSADSIRRALAVWPNQFPAPPEEHPGAWERLKKKVRSHLETGEEAGVDQAIWEAGVAMQLLGHLSLARAVRRATQI